MMSGEMNSREYRQQAIVEMLERLHAGASVDEVKAQFEEVFANVSATEISEAEQALIAGGLPVEEIQRLCDVHAAVMGRSVTQIHLDDTAGDADPTQTPGHPVHTLAQENRAFERLIADVVRPSLQRVLEGDTSAQALGALAGGLAQLRSVDTHYSRKENIFFSYLEKHGIDAPPKVMWGVDDDIRASVKAAHAAAQSFSGDVAQLKNLVDEAVRGVEDMIFKEDNILTPMMLEQFTQAEWVAIEEQSGEIGYALIPEPPRWAAPTGTVSNAAPSVAAAELPTMGEVRLPSGSFTVDQLTRVLNTLPLDMTFVDADDRVAYFSEGTERTFARTRSIIGREVINCHPPASMHVVQSILDDFRSGKKDSEEFWIQMGPKFVYIRYFAVRDDGGTYLGTLEVTQEINGIKALEGEKRLMSE